MRYSDKEAAEILRRASEMQARSGEGNPPLARDLDLGDLQRIGAEVGIEASFIAAAAATMAEQGDGPAPGGSQVVIERAIAGELPSAHWDRIVEEMRRSLGHPGQIAQDERQREWSGGSAGNMAWVTAKQEPGRTVVRITADYGVLTGLSWIVGIGAGAIGGALLAQALSKAGFAGTVAMVSFLLAALLCVAAAQLMVRRLVAGERRRLATLIDGVLREASGTHRPQAPLEASDGEGLTVRG